jgi:hypothetical protein
LFVTESLRASEDDAYVTFQPRQPSRRQRCHEPVGRGKHAVKRDCPRSTAHAAPVCERCVSTSVRLVDLGEAEE